MYLKGSERICEAKNNSKNEIMEIYVGRVKKQSIAVGGEWMQYCGGE